MTVDPRLQLTPGEYLIHPDGSASKVVDKRNLTVDEILATGQYTDRRGRYWHYDTKHRFWITNPPVAGKTWKVWQFGGPFDHAEMRLLIERDQHRDECPGLINCENHPVPCVTLAGGPYGCFHVNPADDSEETYVAHECSHEWAMDTARALAAGE